MYVVYDTVYVVSVYSCVYERNVKYECICRDNTQYTTLLYGVFCGCIRRYVIVQS